MLGFGDAPDPQTMTKEEREKFFARPESLMVSKFCPFNPEQTIW